METTRNQEIYNEYFSGQTLQVVADKYSLTRQRVQQIVKKIGPSRPRIVNAGRLRKFDYKAIAQYVERNDTTIHATATHFGCSISTVMNALYSEGVSPTKKKRFTPSVVQDIVSRYLAGEKLRLIGESYGTSAQYINTVLRRAGATAKRRK